MKLRNKIKANYTQYHNYVNIFLSLLILVILIVLATNYVIPALDDNPVSAGIVEDQFVAFNKYGKAIWKSGLFVVLNLFFIGWLIAIFEMLLRVLHGEDPLALLEILVADIAFLIAGILLIILKRYYHISTTNWALPFIAIFGLTIIVFSNVIPTSLWLGIIITGALIVCSIVTTSITLLRR